MTENQRLVEPMEGRSLTAIPSFNDHEIYWTSGLDRQGVCPAVYELLSHLLISDWIVNRQRDAEWIRPLLAPMSKSFSGWEDSDQRFDQLFELAVSQALEPWVAASGSSCAALDRLLVPADWAAIATGQLEEIPRHYQWLAYPSGIPVLAKAVHYQRVAPITEAERFLVSNQIAEQSHQAALQLLDLWIKPEAK